MSNFGSSGAELARSYLYVPGDSAAMLAKASSRGADALILDLEDAVVPSHKEMARQLVAEHLAHGFAGADRIWVRLNASGSGTAELTAADLATVRSPRLSGFLVPKAENVNQVRFVAHLLDEVERDFGMVPGSFRLVPLIESARGLAIARQLAAERRVVRLQLGEADLTSDLRLEPGEDELELLGPRGELVRASRLAGLDPPVGSVSVELFDDGAFERSTHRLRRLGFFGRAVVHPRQIDPVHRVFSSSQEERAQAAVLLQRFSCAAADGRGVLVDERGRMVDEAVVRRARRTLGIDTDDDSGGRSP